MNNVLNHLSEESLISHALDGAALTADALAHLDGCAACRARMAEFTLLAQELATLKASQPSTAALTRYTDLFVHVRQRRSLLQSALQWVQARLLVDTRSTLALQGVRSAGVSSYRLLYQTPTAEIDLLVEGTGAARNLVGEIVSAEDNPTALPTLVQLIPSQMQQSVETESNDQGRFSLSGVTPGRYSLLLTPASGDAYRIDDLEIS